MRAALYARVSSAIQRDRHTIESQLRVLPDFAIARGWEIVATFTDDGRTAKAGHLDARVGLTQLLAGAALGRFDVVVVIDLDRLTRSEDLTERGAIMGALQRAGVRIAIAATGTIHDLNSDEGDLQVALGGYFAAAWGRKHRTRIVEGKLTAISKGKKPAGPTPYGYRYDRFSGVWSVDENESAIVREVYQRALAGETADRIAEDLHVRGEPLRRGSWDRSTVYRILAQPAYRGEWIADKRRKLTIAVPVIIDPPTWYAVRDRAATSGKRGLRRTKHFYLCESIAVCDLCGGRIMIASASTSSRRVPSPARYICENRRRPARGEQPCGGRYWLCSEVDARVWTAISKLVATPGRLERAVRKHLAATGADEQTWRSDLATAEKRIERLARTEAGILARYQRGIISEEAFDLFLQGATRERVMAQHQVDAARRAEAAASRVRTRATELESLVGELRRMVEKASPEQSRALVGRVLQPGAIRLSIATVTLQVALGSGTEASPGLASVSGSSEEHDATLKLHVVA